MGNVEAPSTIYFNDSSAPRSDLSAPRSGLIGRHYTPVHFGDNKGTAVETPALRGWIEL